MRVLFVLLLLPLISMSQDASDIVQFADESIYIGEVVKGDKIESTFTFKNISTDDIEIDIVSTCECTEATWPQYPITPGESGSIKFIFDSSQKDKEEPIEVDVYFVNTNPKTGNPYSAFLSYTFKWKK